MKTILSLDGGGAKGPMQMEALAMLEEASGVRTCDRFDLIIGTSVGAINGAMLATGRYPARTLVDVMRVELPKVFKRRYFKRAKYSKEPLAQAFANLFGPGACMGDAATKLIVTSYEDTEGRMHFFKSWEDKDSLLSLFGAVDRSSAAPFFFGPVVDYGEARVWLDGGVGIFNNPAAYACVEATRLGWQDEGVQCISLGCGHKNNARQFKDAADDRKLGQILNYVDPADGGLAHRSAMSSMCDLLSNLGGDWWGFKRVDTVLADKFDAMDKTKYFDEYIRKGKGLGVELIKCVM